MSYQRRMQVAAVLSIVLHALALLGYVALPHPAGIAPEPEPEPFVVDLRPPDERPRRLVDVNSPADEPVRDTDLIAPEASKARDQMAHAGEELGPQPDVLSDLESLRLPPQVPPAPVVPPVPSQTPEQEPVEPTEEKQVPEEREAPEEPQEETLPTAVEEKQQEEIEDRQERFQMAQAPSPPRPQERPDPTRGRSRRVEQKGLSSFEALQDELAPYLKHIRDRVEREWFARIGRYHGTNPRYVELDVAIRPNGTLEYVRYIGEPEDLLFGAICEQSIRQAAPFNPFPFSVPDIYREKNLQIRYSFSFL